MIGLLKKLPLFAAAVCLSATIRAADVNAFVRPPAINLGQHFELVLESADGVPRLINGFDGAHITGVSQFSNIVNGKASHSTGYTCVPTAAGVLEIPPLNVYVNGETVKTPPLTVAVNRSLADELREPPARSSSAPKRAEDGEEDSGSGAMALKLSKEGEAVFGIGAFPDERRDFYIGEVVPMELRLYLRRGADRQILSYPELDAGKAVITDFSSINRHNPNFANYEQRVERLNGADYDVVVFPTSFRPMAPGVVQVAARQLLGAPGLSRLPAGYLEYHIPEITIRQLPPPPPGVLYTGLSGNWTVSVAQNREEATAGEAIELTVTVSGEGALEGLKPPEISIPDCRVYPPELKTYHGYNYACLTYIVIPIKPGDVERQLRLATFSPSAGEYRECDFVFHARVTGSAAADRRPSTAGGLYDPDDEPAGSEPRHQLKLRPAAPVKLPLWKNHLPLTVAFLAAGPLLWAVSILMNASRRASENGANRRNRRAVSRRGKVLRRIAEVPEDELLEVVNSQVVPFLNDAFGYPPGSDASTIADRSTDPELADLMRTAAAAGYLPENERKPADCGKFRRALLKTLKRLTATAIVCAAAAAAAYATEPEAWRDACDLLATGDNEQAVRAFADLLNPAEPDPAADFNLGAAAFGAGDYPLSLWAFEQAHLLAPRDAEITDSLNVLRRRFFLPEAGDTSTTPRMLAVLRDSFRPDEYLLAAAVMVFAAFATALLRRKIGRPQCLAGTAVCAAAALALATAAVWQLHDAYSPARALVVAPEAALRTMPSETDRESAPLLRGGASVEIVDSARNGYTQVKCGRRSGFLRNDELRALLP